MAKFVLWHVHVYVCIGSSRNERVCKGEDREKNQQKLIVRLSRSSSVTHPLHMRSGWIGLHHHAHTLQTADCTHCLLAQPNRLETKRIECTMSTTMKRNETQYVVCSSLKQEQMASCVACIKIDSIKCYECRVRPFVPTDDERAQRRRCKPIGYFHHIEHTHDYRSRPEEY